MRNGCHIHTLPRVTWPIFSFLEVSSKTIRSLYNIKLLYTFKLVDSNHKQSIKQDACWTISNIMAGNNERMQAFIEAGIIAPLVQLFGNAEFEMKKVAAWAVATAAAVGTHEQIKFLVGEDEKNLGHTGEVNVYTQLIDEAEGLKKIENLQSHENNEIYEKVVKLLGTYADGAPQLISEIKQFLINLFQNSAETIEIKRIQRLYDEIIESEIAYRLDRYDASEKELRQSMVQSKFKAS
ncbi:hypothetical protein POM88_012326 [Heracleum sosnowskyi]|uniref:Uncharacterized protein n=1 Tax=Heracleum sosnowskyi TaxID=360622 RepID=A0AAD8MXA3_9APIA|nr:hypothetical protein POM88_012326 [Heracleum sosnowskyi]